jgi:hypothetical protein
MQTFLPLPDFEQSARVLDYRRLGKQRVEARQLLKAICDEHNGWHRHPAARMWSGHTAALTEYGNAMIREWIRRGYVNNLRLVNNGTVILPPWLGDERLHASHRSNLLRKDQEYYGQFGWSEPPDLPYFWPSKEGYRV